MDKEKWTRAGTVFGSCYIKRWLETRYDQLMDMPSMAKLKGASPGMKYGIEAILYALTAYAEQKTSDSSPLGLMVKTVLMDAASEISRRLLRDAREELSSLAAGVDSVSPTPTPQSAIAGKLFSLDDALLLSILSSLEEMDEAAREKFLEFVAKASAEELTRFAALPPDRRNGFLNLQATDGQTRATESDGGWTASFKSFAKDVGQVLKAGAQKTTDVSLLTINRYLMALLWVLKASAVLWGMAFFICAASAICGRWSLFIVLLGLLCASGAIAFLGRQWQKSWLSVAGILSGAVIAILISLTASGHPDSAFGVTVFFLVGMPILAIVAMLIPVTTVLEILRSLPFDFSALVRPFQMLFTAFVGIFFSSVTLLLFPPQNAVAFLFNVMLTLLIASCIGFGLMRINPTACLRPSFIIGMTILLMGAFGVMSMPNLRLKLSTLNKKIDLALVDSPKAITFNSSKDIEFVSMKDGEVKIWYADTEPKSGYDLYRCEGVGPYYAKDGRLLRKADNDAIRQKISAWVDQTAVQRQKQTAEEKTKADEARRLSEMEKAKADEVRRASAEQARRASYLATSNLPSKVDFIVCAATASKTPLSDFSAAVSAQLQGKGKTASTTVFAPAFVSGGGFDLFFNNQSGDDLKVMPLSRMGSKLLLIRCDETIAEVSKTIANVYTSSIRISFNTIDATDGKVIKAGELSATGPGINEKDAKNLAFERIIEKLIPQLIDP